MEIVGKVIQILPCQEGIGKNGNPWKSQSFIIETIENYPRKACITIFGEERIKNNPFEVDQIVRVSFDIESREFNGRWYTSIMAWKIAPEVAQPAAATTQAAPTGSAPLPFDNGSNESEESQTDLPF